MTEPTLPSILPADLSAESLAGIVRLTDFLPPEEHDRLLARALSLEPDLVDSSTEGADDYRQSWVLYDAETFAASLVERIQALMPALCQRFALPPLPAKTRIELQCTAHNDGHFYKIHNDNDGPDAVVRELTFVYYLHRLPRGFEGGQLLVYEREGRHGIKLGPGTPVTIEPADNSLVIFRAGRLHEVLPVRCPSKNFADSRFTLNGWVWR